MCVCIKERTRIFISSEKKSAYRPNKGILNHSLQKTLLHNLSEFRST